MLKKIILLLIIIFSLIDIKVARGEIKSPESLSQYMRKEFSYQKGNSNHWKTPTETEKDKGGMCADFTFYVQKVLSDLGYETMSIAIIGTQYIDGKKEKFAHAICIIKVNGGYKYFSNQYYSYFKIFKNIQEIIDFECIDWKYWAEISLPHEFKNKNYKITTY